MSRLPQKPAPVTGPESAGEGPGARVERLPDALVDQIAAGEVVERPASVVKELVENALDADAGRVRVEVREGGAALVAVTDDGLGMTPDDARLALERHATSKLRRLDDLTGIGTFGFRGEALPSIASVSRLRLRTRARGAAEAYEIRIDGGEVVRAHPASGPEGTRIEVADLFAQIPARRKFLKSAATEWGHIADWMSRVALAVPTVHFDVSRDERAVLQWPAAKDPLDRIAAVLSEGEAAALQTAERQAGDLSVRVFASHPSHHRATGAGIHLFVDGRPVRDRVLRHAILQVYRDVLPRGRFPTVLVYLEVSPGGVDVNVHPAKWEVRFADPQAAHQALRGALGDVLAQRGWLAPGGASSQGGGASSETAGGAPVERATGDVPASSRGWSSLPPERQAASAATSDWVLAERPGAGVEGFQPAGVAGLARPARFGELRLLGQLLATYLLVEDKGALLLVDQHAAHERILYERLRAGWQEGGVARQALLVPETLELDATRMAAVREHAERVEGLGFEVEPFGERTAVVRAVPELLAERDPMGVLRGLLDELAGAGDAGGEGGRGDSRMLDAADHRFASMACHAARRAGEVLSEDEQRALLDALDAIPWAPTCPHGRPVAVPIGLDEIERRFSRR